MIRIKSLNKKELKEFVQTSEYLQYDFLPITKHRALSQCANPHAHDDHQLLFLAFEGERLAGYLGSLPDTLNVLGQPIHYAWLSTLYVSPHFRGKKIAQKLLSSAFEAYNNRIAITEFTPEAESLYNKIGVFTYREAKQGIRWYFKFDLAKILPQKKRVFQSFIPLLKIVDSVGNKLVSLTQYSGKKTSSITTDFTPEIEMFVKKEGGTEAVNRLQWIVQNPWLLEGPADSRYLFSSFVKSFSYRFIVFRNSKNEIEGVWFTSIRDGHFKILYQFGDYYTHEHWLLVRNFIY